MLQILPPWGRRVFIDWVGKGELNTYTESGEVERSHAGVLGRREG